MTSVALFLHCPPCFNCLRSNYSSFIISLSSGHVLYQYTQILVCLCIYLLLPFGTSMKLKSLAYCLFICVKGNLHKNWLCINVMTPALQRITCTYSYATCIAFLTPNHPPMPSYLINLKRNNHPP